MRKLGLQEVQNLLLELMKKLHKFLQDNGIKYYLIAGSALGAIRHNGFIPWDDDIDIGIFRADYEKFLSIVNEFDLSGYQVKNLKNDDYCDYFLTRIYINDTFIDNKKIEKTKLDKRLYLDVFPLDNVPEDEKSCQKLENKLKKQKRKLTLCDLRTYNGNKLKTLARKVVSLFMSPMRKSILKRGDKLIKTYAGIKTDYVCSLCSQYSFKKQKMPKEYYGTPTLVPFCDTKFYVPNQIENYLSRLYGSDYMQLPPIEKRREGCAVYTTK